MKTISLKIDDSLLKEIDGSLKKYRYSTRTEFIRDAVRTKLSQAEKEELYKHIDKLKGISKRKTTDEDLHRSRERVVQDLEREFGI